MKKHSDAHHHKVTEHAKSLLAATAHISEAKVKEVHSKLSDLIESAGDAVNYVENKAVESAEQADEYIRARPYQAVGIAIGIGTLIGFCIARRK